MPRNQQFPVIRNFLGVNVRDSGTKADFREFLKAQNFYQKEKGVYYKTPGSTYDLSATDVYGADRITAMHRHPTGMCPKAILYHCTPTSTPIAQPSGNDLTLTEITATDGTIFDANGGIVSNIVKFCYSYIGMGVESAWDTWKRTGWDPTKVNAWEQPGLSSITLASKTNKVQVQHATAFPSGVRAVNIFMSIGGSTSDADTRQLVYVGTLHNNSETLLVDTSIGPAASAVDSFTSANMYADAVYDANGNIPEGQYYISLAWVSDGQIYNPVNIANWEAFTQIGVSKLVTVEKGLNSLVVNYGQSTAISTNGATHVYVFIGSKDINLGTMTCVGSFRITTGLSQTAALTINEIPYNTNVSAGDNYFYHIPHQLSFQMYERNGFIVKYDPDRPVSISEVFPSRSEFGWQEQSYYYADLILRTPKDYVYFGSGSVVATVDPDVIVPTFCYFQGASYMANGSQFMYTDAIGISNMRPSTGNIIPSYPKFIFAFKDQLVCSTSDTQDALYGSNATDANNWSDGGSGSALRWAVLGDPFEGKINGAASFAYSTGTQGPQSFLMAFKKNSIWSLSDIPDSTSGIQATADQVSGRVGTVAPRTIVQTKIGMIFLGSDGDLYMIRGNGEPLPVGAKVKDFFSHLVGNDSLMSMCNAVLHGNYYKISYPSASTSTYCDAQLWADLRTEDGEGILWSGPHIGISLNAQLVLSTDDDNGDRIGAMGDQAGSAKMDDETTYQHLGTNITSILEWTQRRLNAEFNIKKFKGIFLENYYDTTDAQSVLVEGFSDTEYAQSSQVLSTGNANGEALWRRELIYFIDDNLIGVDFKFKITHAANAQFLISAIGVPFKPERRFSS